MDGWRFICWKTWRSLTWLMNARFITDLDDPQVSVGNGFTNARQFRDQWKLGSDVLQDSSHLLVIVVRES